MEHLLPQLKGLAYRMLGSAADAEDAVQEALLRLHMADPKPDSEDAFLYRVVSNLCVDRLRRLKVERKHYFGPWLPEPVADEALDVADTLEVQQDLNVGFMLLLEHLSPAERIVFLLKEAFDFSYREISELLGITPANARQRGHRAGVRLRSARQQSELEGDTLSVPWRQQGRDRARQKKLLAALSTKIATGDVPGLISMMHEDAVAYTDGGGVVSAAIRPIVGPQRIAQVATFLADKSQQQGRFDERFVQVNGSWSLVGVQAGAIHSVSQILEQDGLIKRFYVMRNPHKLIHLTGYMGLSPAK